MFDVLSDPQHRVANLLFVAFNILAVVTIVAGIIEFGILSQSSDLKSISGALQFLVLGAVGWWNVFLAAIYLTMAQVLRLLVNIASGSSQASRGTASTGLSHGSGT